MLFISAFPRSVTLSWCWGGDRYPSARGGWRGWRRKLMPGKRSLKPLGAEAWCSESRGARWLGGSQRQPQREAVSPR